MAKKTPQCSKCPSVVCSPPIGATARAPLTEAPAFCPMKNEAGVLKKALSEYQKPRIKEFARQASIQEFECYETTPQGRRTRNPRIVELIEFGKKMGYKKLGLAFCTGLHAEAETVTRILENSGYEVVSARCKVGAVPKEVIGIQPGEKRTAVADQQLVRNFIFPMLKTYFHGKPFSRQAHRQQSAMLAASRRFNKNWLILFTAHS